MATSSYLSESDKSPRHVTIREDIRKYVRELDMLPSPSFVAARLLNTLMDENPDPRDVQKLLELDQATSLKLFRYANSPLSASQSPVASIPDALASLGVSQLRGVLWGVAISEALIAEIRSKPGNDQTTLWKHALTSAICAQLLAEQILPALASEAFAMGLLHDIGKLVLEECVPEQYKQVRAVHRETGMPLIEAEGKTLGIDHSTVGKWLAERWNLPLLLVQGIWLHHHSFEVIAKLDFPSEEHRKLILILSLADDLAHEVMLDAERSNQPTTATADTAAFLGLGSEYLERMRVAARERYSQYATLLGSGEGELSVYVGALQRANQKLVRLTSQEIQLQTQEKLIQDLSHLHDFHAELSSIEDREDLLQRVAREMAEGLGKKDGLIYLLRRETRKLVGRQWAPGKALRDFSLDLNEACLPVRHDVPFLEANLNQLIQTCHTRFRKATRENQQRILFQYYKPYIIIPLIVDGEFNGEIFINNEKNEPLREAGLSVYRYLADAVAQTLSHIQTLEKLRDNAEMLNTALSRIDRAVKTAEETGLQRQALLEAAEKRERLEATLRNIPCGVIASDTKGNIVFCNRAAEALTGWLEAEAVGKSLDTVFTLIDMKADRPFENLLEKKGKKSEYEEYPDGTAIVSKGTEGRLITVDAARAYDKDNNVIGMVTVLRDLSGKIAAEEERLRSQKLRSLKALAGGIAHDFNNLLTVIMGNISLAEVSLKSGQDNPIERLSEAEKACLKAKDFTQQLIVFANGGKFFKRRRAIADMVKDAIITGLSDSPVNCSADLPEDLWPVDCDAIQIHQMIGNLLVNARESMPSGGTIEVKARNVSLAADEISPLDEGDYVRISITDHGVGVPRENISEIFDPYSTSRDKVYRRGRGLGLAIAHSIAKGHEGNIIVKSEEGNGSTFHVYLPSAEKTAAKTDSSATTEPEEALDELHLSYDRRRHARWKARWPITALIGGQSILEGETRDVSISGACVRLGDLIEPGKEFRMIIKPSDSRFVSVTSEVIWSLTNGESASPGLPRMGVRFLEITDEDRRLLTELASN